MESNKIRYYITIAAAAFIFVVFGIWELVNPDYWVGFVPSYMYIINPKILVLVHGAVLTIIGIWIATQRWLKIAAIAGTLVMLEIVVDLLVSSGFSDLFVRDFTILLFVLSLAFEENKYGKHVRKRN